MAAKNADAAQNLFSWTSEFYQAAQDSFDAQLSELLARRREACVTGGDCVCTPAVCMDDVVRSRFDGLGKIADEGLVPMDANGHADAEAGAEAGRRLAEKYLVHLEETVVEDEMRLQSGNMLGHMVRYRDPSVDSNPVAPPCGLLRRRRALCAVPVALIKRAN